MPRVVVSRSFGNRNTILNNYFQTMSIEPNRTTNQLNAIEHNRMIAIRLSNAIESQSNFTPISWFDWDSIVFDCVRLRSVLLDCLIFDWIDCVRLCDPVCETIIDMTRLFRVAHYLYLADYCTFLTNSTTTAFFLVDRTQSILIEHNRHQLNIIDTNRTQSTLIDGNRTQSNFTPILLVRLWFDCVR